MAKKAIKKRIRKTRKTVKRGLRHQIVINPNASVRSNIIPQPQNQNSGSARSQMMANLQNPFLPIALSQTPPNVNLDAVHNMRNQNDLRQQQINDTKREKDDELARKKYLDEQERKMKKATKDAEAKYNEEKKQREIMEKHIEEQEKQLRRAEQEREEANRLTDTYREMTKKYSGLKNTFDLNELKNKRDFMKASIAEMEFNIQQQEAEIEQSQIKKEIDSLNAQTKMLNERKKQAQELAQKYKSEVGLSLLVRAEHEKNLATYQAKVTEERLEVFEKNQKLKAQYQAALSQAEMEKINNFEREKITAAIQENVILEQAIKEKELDQKLFEEHQQLLHNEHKRKIHLNAELDRLTEINNQNSSNLEKQLHDEIIVNANKQKAIEQNQQLEKARKRRFESWKKEQEAEAAVNYYMTPESVNLQNQIVEAEKQTIMALKKTEELNNARKANEELRKSNIAYEKAQHILNNNDASIIAEVNYATDQLSAAQNKSLEFAQELAKVKSNINHKYSILPKQLLDEFYANNNKYQLVLQNDPNNLDLDYLKSLDRDLGAFIDQKNIQSRFIPQNQ